MERWVLKKSALGKNLNDLTWHGVCTTALSRLHRCEVVNQSDVSKEDNAAIRLLRSSDRRRKRQDTLWFRKPGRSTHRFCNYDSVEREKHTEHLVPAALSNITIAVGNRQHATGL